MATRDANGWPMLGIEGSLRPTSVDDFGPQPGARLMPPTQRVYSNALATTAPADAGWADPNRVERNVAPLTTPNPWSAAPAYHAAAPWARAAVDEPPAVSAARAAETSELWENTLAAERSAAPWNQPIAHAWDRPTSSTRTSRPVTKPAFTRAEKLAMGLAALDLEIDMLAQVKQVLFKEPSNLTIAIVKGEVAVVRQEVAKISSSFNPRNYAANAAPLIVAVYCQQPAIVDLLLTAGFDSYREMEVERMRITALSCAVLRNDNDSLISLLASTEVTQLSSGEKYSIGECYRLAAQLNRVTSMSLLMEFFPPTGGILAIVTDIMLQTHNAVMMRLFSARQLLSDAVLAAAAQSGDFTLTVAVLTDRTDLTAAEQVTIAEELVQRLAFDNDNLRNINAEVSYWLQAA